MSDPAVQGLSGQWSYVNGNPHLGEDPESATLGASEDLLRLGTSEGKLVLYRDEIR